MKKEFLKKAVCVTTTIIFVVAIFNTTVLSKEAEPTLSANPLKGTWIVDDEGDGDYTLIQDAINAASDGDIIEVYSGTYTENILIDMELELIGIDTEYMNGGDSGKPIIDGNMVKDVISVFTGGSFPVTIMGFVIQNSGMRDSGIFVDFSADVHIAENDIKDNHHGIHVYHSCTTIEENMVFDNEWGILTEFSDHCIITENIMENNHIGMDLDSSNELTVNRNDFTNNSDYGLILERSPLNEISFNNFLDNDRHAWFKNCINQWHDNYWGNRLINFPVYVIIGRFQFPIFPALIIPIAQFDLRAKSTPN